MADSRLNDFISRGTNAQRVAFTPSPPTPGSGNSPGYFFYETDTGNTYAWTGAAWAAVNASGTMTLITETTTSASQASVTFSSISASYRDLLVVVRGRGTVAAISADVIIQLNADTGANYDYESGHAYHSTITGGASVATTFYYVGAISGDSATASAAGAATTRIFDYRGTTFHKAFLSDSATKEGTTTANMGRFFNSGFWRSTAAVNAVKVFFASGSFKDGSIVSLYGLM